MVAAGTGAAPFRALPPLAPYGEDDVAADLLGAVSAEMCDLGIGEADDPVLGEVAGALVELTGRFAAAPAVGGGGGPETRQDAGLDGEASG